LGEDDENNDLATVETGGRVLNVFDIVEDDQEEEGVKEISEEEGARREFDQLRGASESLPLVEFLRWKDLQELLECEALSKDSLAACIENAGGAAERGELTFPEFFELIRTIDDFLDRDKLPKEKQVQDVVYERSMKAGSPQDVQRAMALVDEMLSESEEDGEEVKITYLNNDKVSRGEKALQALGADLEADAEAEAEDDLEVQEMFGDLSKGKDTISLKDLREWDELEALLESNLASEDTVESYFTRLGFREDKRIDFAAFSEFIKLIDTVLVDEKGNILGIEDEDKAVAL